MAVRRQEDTGGMANGVTLYAPSWDNQWLPPELDYEYSNMVMAKAFEQYLKEVVHEQL